MAAFSFQTSYIACTSASILNIAALLWVIADRFFKGHVPAIETTLLWFGLLALSISASSRIDYLVRNYFHYQRHVVLESTGSVSLLVVGLLTKELPNYVLFISYLSFGITLFTHVLHKNGWEEAT